MFDLISLIRAAGYIGIFAIIFAESGLLIGFFLPGDSLLFTAGFLASQGYLNIWLLIAVAFPAAIIGDQVGYAFGKKVGPRIFYRDDSLFFHKNYLTTARLFFERHGPKTIVIARFIPIIRTFAPILAGVGHMRYTTFLTYNIIGAVIWAIAVPLIGFYIGNFIPNAGRYLFEIITLIVVISILPNIIHVLNNKTTRKQLANFLRSKFLER